MADDAKRAILEKSEWHEAWQYTDGGAGKNPDANLHKGLVRLKGVHELNMRVQVFRLPNREVKVRVWDMSAVAVDAPEFMQYQG